MSETAPEITADDVPPALVAAVHVAAAPIEASQAALVIGQIRAELGRAQMSQSALADKLEVSHSWVYRRLTGEAALTVADVHSVAAAIGVDLEVLTAQLPDPGDAR